MQTHVSILHHDYPSRVRETVEEKLQGLLKYYDRITSVRARLERLNEDHRVELVANVPHGPVLVADARAEMFMGALDEAVNKMTRMLKRAHDKQRTERRREGRTP